MRTQFKVRKDTKEGENFIPLLKTVGIIALGCYFIYMSFWVPLVFLILSIPLLYIHDGVIFYDNTYYEFTSYFGIKFGKHHELPPVSYIIVRDVRFVNPKRRESDKNTLNEMYEVALVCGERDKIVLIHTGLPPLKGHVIILVVIFMTLVVKN